MRFQQFAFVSLLTLAVSPVYALSATSGTPSQITQTTDSDKVFNPSIFSVQSSKSELNLFNSQHQSAGSKQATDADSAAIIDTEGVLETGDSVLSSDQSLYDEYSFTGRAGQQVTISLESPDFDAFLMLVGPDGEVVEQNDDFDSSSTNAQINIALPTNGVYTLIVNTYSPGEQGQYHLTATTVLGTGDVQATLRWNTTDDLDLAVMDPTGEMVAFDNAEIGSGGKLDVDANAQCEGVVTSPVENVFWPPAQAPQGEYKIAVSLYSRCSDTQGPIDFTLTLQVQGQTEVLQGTVDEENNIVMFSTAVY